MQAIAETQKSVPERARDFLGRSPDLMQVEDIKTMASKPFPHVSRVFIGIAPRTAVRSRKELSELAMRVMRGIPGGSLHYDTRNDREFCGIPRLMYEEDLGSRVETVRVTIKDRETLELNMGCETKKEFPNMVFDEKGEFVKRWDDPATRITSITVYPRDIVARVKPVGMSLSVKDAELLIPGFDFELRE